MALSKYNRTTNKNTTKVLLKNCTSIDKELYPQIMFSKIKSIYVKQSKIYTIRVVYFIYYVICLSRV